MTTMESMWAPFLTWQFATASVFVAAAMLVVKGVLVELIPRALGNRWVKAGLTLANVALGLLTAIPADWLPGRGFAQRAFMGVVAGVVSQFVYSALIKRLQGGQASAKEKPAVPEETP
jgi:hypothetical protein